MSLGMYFWVIYPTDYFALEELNIKSAYFLVLVSLTKPPIDARRKKLRNCKGRQDDF